MMVWPAPLAYSWVRLPTATSLVMEELSALSIVPRLMAPGSVFSHIHVSIVISLFKLQPSSLHPTQSPRTLCTNVLLCNYYVFLLLLLMFISEVRLR